ncbi:MAG TPA: hypothetical protein DIU14_06855, partial [Actinobacteria bacterium]|nr:hypothetical protein [Actinomycetota bacterium]
ACTDSRPSARCSRRQRTRHEHSNRSPPSRSPHGQRSDRSRSGIDSALSRGGGQMRILVTGGTGLVGSHAVAALIERGHDLRLLVRSPASIGPAFDPLGLSHPEHVTGDVTNAASVDAAMEGCDAVLHAAAVYSLDSRDAERIRRTNVPGARTVLGAAAARGLDPIVYISSFTAFFPPNGR